MLDDASAAIEFYQRALSATELFRIAGPGGQILHAEISVSGAVVMVGDAQPPFAAPTASGSTTVGLHVYLDDADADAALARAEQTGAIILQPVEDMFYGDRAGMLQNPFGHIWVPLTHQEDLEPVEIVSKAGTAYLLSADQWRSLMETAHLLRSPVNAERLLRSIADAEAGHVEVQELLDPQHDIAEDQLHPRRVGGLHLLGQRTKTLKRINRMIEEAARDPATGIGKPERLSHHLSGYPRHRRTPPRPSTPERRTHHRTSAIPLLSGRGWKSVEGSTVAH